MSNENFYDVVVIGGGPAGLTAALYLARACYRVLVIEKEKFGGQITITDEVVNYPGVMKTSGKELTQAMQKQAEHFGAEFLLGDVVSLKKAEEASGAEIWETTTDKGSYKSFGILLATGAHPRMIGFPGEAKFRGHGVAYCATCDGEFFRGKEIFVVGGGFAAAEESVFLTKYASHVTILIRGNDFSCAEAVAEAAKNHPKITVLTNTEVVYVEGDHTLRKICYKNKNTGEETIFDSADDTFGISSDSAALLPFVEVLTASGEKTGLAFHGVPGGHEFTSFILGLYNAAGPGQPLDPAIRERILAIDHKVHMQILVSLSCTMCPDLVVAAQRIASLNLLVTAEVYDIAHFPDLKEKYNVMSVPCLIINQDQVTFGKKNIPQLLELL